nr:MAG TPA: hypothetical protein [Caudoviricetes sp.]
MLNQAFLLCQNIFDSNLTVTSFFPGRDYPPCKKNRIRTKWLPSKTG